jgi:cupin 2 domain-containing protein
MDPRLLGERWLSFQLCLCHCRRMALPFHPDGANASIADMMRLSPGEGQDERFEDLLRRPGVRIERIVSHGNVTPPHAPYVQGWDEWVLVLQGAAELRLEGLGERKLAAGEGLLIPAGVAHWVTYTADPTIWLAVHIGEP